MREYVGSMFPVDVVGPDGVEHKICRVVASGSGTVVWEWSATERAGVPIFQSPQRPLIVNDQARIREYVLALDDDTTLDLFADRTNCGCSHPMKRWVPPGLASVGT